jgi:hypothetical protein
LGLSQAGFNESSSVAYAEANSLNLKNIPAFFSGSAPPKGADDPFLWPSGHPVPLVGARLDTPSRRPGSGAFRDGAVGTVEQLE